MALNLNDPIFHDDEKAREFLETQRWPHGPVCPHCGEKHDIHRMEGETHQAGMCYCRICRKKFTVTVGTVMERSHIPLSKWMLGFRLMAASKKGMSAHQLHRMLGITYKSAWFMAHRIREAMAPDAKSSGPIGGPGKIVEGDETYVGGNKHNVHLGKPEPKKKPVIALVERGGEVRAKHVPTVSMKTLRKTLTKHASRKSTLMTDDSPVSRNLRKEFAAHGVVVHSKREYVGKDGLTHTQTVESFFALLKRGVYGTFHAVSEAHLQRYVNEAAFKWNTRASLDFDDAARTAAALKGIEGKRLTYRPIDQA